VTLTAFVTGACDKTFCHASRSTIRHTCGISAAMDTMQLIAAKKAETAKRVAKLRNQLEAAEAELEKLEITAETLTRLGLNPEVETAVPRGQSVTHVLSVLDDSEFGGKTPKEIHDALTANGITSITQDNVRTILARNKSSIETSDGRYWRKPDERDAVRPESRTSAFDEEAFGSEPPKDDDVEF
jgi:hypothetical protein